MTGVQTCALPIFKNNKIKEVEKINEMKEKVNEIDQLKSDVNEMKDMMKLILSKLDSNS